MAPNMQEFLSTGKYSDITVICHDESFHLHRIVLAAGSPVFDKMLNGPFKESTTQPPTITLEDDTLALQALLYHLYTGSYTLLDKTNPLPFIIRVYAIGHKYQIPALTALAASHLRQNFRPPPTDGDFQDFLNAIRMVDTCTNPNDTTMEDIVMPVLKKNMAVLMQTPAFREMVLGDEELNVKLLMMKDPPPPPMALNPPNSWLMPMMPDYRY